MTKIRPSIFLISFVTIFIPIFHCLSNTDETDKILAEIKSTLQQNPSCPGYFGDRVRVIEDTLLISQSKINLRLPDGHGCLETLESEIMVRSLQEEWQRYEQNLKYQLLRDHVINVQDFGAKGDARTDDSQAFAESVKKLRELGAGYRLLIPQGTYVLASRDANRPRFHWVIEGLKDILIEGETGTFLVMKNPAAGIGFIECDNVTLRNIGIIYDPLPYTQGEIISVDGKNRTFDVQIMPGFPAPTLDYFQKAEIPRGFCREPVTLRYLFTTDSIFKQPPQELGNQRYRFPISENRKVEDFKTGFIFSFHARGPRLYGNGVELHGCRFTALEKVSVHSCFGNALYGCGGEALRFSDCQIVPLPGTMRLTPNNADGIFVVGAAVGPVVEDCTFVNSFDDCVTIVGGYYAIQAREGEKSLLVEDSVEGNYEFFGGLVPDFTPGDYAGIFDPKNGELVSYDKIVKVEKLVYKGRKSYRLEMTQPIQKVVTRDELGYLPMVFREHFHHREKFIESGKVDYYLCPLSKASSGYVIKNNTIIKHFGRSGALDITSRNGFIKGNYFRDAFIKRVFVGFPDMLAPYFSNTVFEDNYLERSYFLTEYTLLGPVTHESVPSSVIWYLGEIFFTILPQLLTHASIPTHWLFLCS